MDTEYSRGNNSNHLIRNKREKAEEKVLGSKAKTKNYTGRETPCIILGKRGTLARTAMSLCP